MRIRLAAATLDGPHSWNQDERSLSDGFGGGRCGGAAPAQGRAEGPTAKLQWIVKSGWWIERTRYSCLAQGHEIDHGGNAVCSALTMDGSRASVVADPGIDHDVDDVHDQECDDGQDGEENDVEKDDGIVAGHDGLGHEVADTGPGEDDFDDDDGADEMRQG